MVTTVWHKIDNRLEIEDSIHNSGLSWIKIMEHIEFIRMSVVMSAHDSLPAIVAVIMPSFSDICV